MIVVNGVIFVTVVTVEFVVSVETGVIVVYLGRLLLFLLFCCTICRDSFYC